MWFFWFRISFLSIREKTFFSDLLFLDERFIVGREWCRACFQISMVRSVGTVPFFENGETMDFLNVDDQVPGIAEVLLAGGAK